MKIILMLILALIFASCAYKRKEGPVEDRMICHKNVLSDRLVCEHLGTIPEASVEL